MFGWLHTDGFVEFCAPKELYLCFAKPSREVGSDVQQIREFPRCICDLGGKDFYGADEPQCEARQAAEILRNSS